MNDTEISKELVRLAKDIQAGMLVGGATNVGTLLAASSIIDKAHGLEKDWKTEACRCKDAIKERDTLSVRLNECVEALKEANKWCEGTAKYEHACYMAQQAISNATKPL